MNKGTLEITLKSDLCAGSGYSYAGIVDSDICYDDLGLPYIPGRRIKGCFRETAKSLLYKLIDDKKSEELFGKAGDSDYADDTRSMEEGRLRIGNAYLKNYAEIRKVLLSIDRNKYNPQRVLDLFSHVVGQTELDEQGSANDGSLRYTRVINHYSITDQTELKFFADIRGSFSEDDDLIENIAKGTRNIGLKRNRGMGSVKCNIEWNKPVDKVSIQELIDAHCSENKDNATDRVITYGLTNVEPLMLSRETEDESESYIYGQEILGALASRYLAHPGSSADDQMFKDLFLNGKVRYTNAYPYEMSGNDIRIYYPAPEYINKLKKTQKLVNVLDMSLFDNEEEGTDYNIQNGNQPKKLKGKFVWNNEDYTTFDVKEVKKELIYHHSHYKKNADENDGILYSAEAIAPYRDFAGKIHCPEKYVKLITALLKEDDIFLGKSRMAQYGRCVANVFDEKENKKSSGDNEEKVSFEVKKGDRILLTLRSDAVLIDKESNESTVYIDKLYPLVAEAIAENTVDRSLKLKSEYCERNQEDQEYTINKDNHKGTIIRTGKMTGYKGVWNLRKEVVPCIKAGSSFIYTVENEAKAEIYKDFFIGEKNHEGYGMVTVIPLPRLPDRIKHKGLDIKIENFNTDRCPDNNLSERSEIFLKERKIIDDKIWLEEIKRTYMQDEHKINISKSAIGRITLMLKESISENTDYEKRYNSFAERIESIEKKATREEGEKLLEVFGHIKDKDNKEWEFNWKDAGCDDPERNKLWSQCLMTLLLINKYEKGAE